MVGFGRPPRGFGSGFGSNPAAMDKAMAQKATASDDSPIPGYMYGEFAKASKRRSSLGINSKSQENTVRLR